MEIVKKSKPSKISKSRPKETVGGLLSKSKDGCIKVKLTYRTNKPAHYRNVFLKRVCDAEPPFLEEVFILVPQNRVFPLLEVFVPYFNLLGTTGVIASMSELIDFKIVEEDDSTLACVF